MESESPLFKLAKEITKPRAVKDATFVVFEEMKKDIMFAIQMGPLTELEARLDMLLFKYEAHVRRMLEITRGIDT